MNNGKPVERKRRERSARGTKTSVFEEYEGGGLRAPPFLALPAEGDSGPVEIVKVKILTGCEGRSSGAVGRHRGRRDGTESIDEVDKDRLEAPDHTNAERNSRDLCKKYERKARRVR